MSYSAEIKRTNPSCLIFLVDQSGSMADAYGSDMGTSKSHALADVLNKLIQNLVIKCSRSEAVWDFYSVSIIGYGEKVGPAFAGSLSGQELVPVSAVAQNPARIEDRMKKVSDGAGGVIDQPVKFPVWFDAVARGGTPMADAFRQAKTILSGWIPAHPDAFPPIIINITDGEADKDPSMEAAELRNMSTLDGNVLVFNIHISSLSGNKVEYPDNETNLVDGYAKSLFRMSSVLPEYMRDLVAKDGIQVSSNTRGFAFAADLAGVIRFLDIGTRPQNLVAR
jgi:hypothetical protein